jgi:fructose-specific phosphotransferase system IIC component
MRKTSESENRNARPLALLAPLDPLALGIAVSIVSGALLFTATLILVLRGGDPVGPHLSLLSQYVPYYSVTWPGSLVGAGGGMVFGFVAGGMVALVRNLYVRAYIQMQVLRARLDRYLDTI